MSEKLLDGIQRRLNAKTIHDLRQIARAVGVPRPADGRKERILQCILQIASGESDPAIPSVKGAHPKSDEYDRQLVADIMRCREASLAASNTSDGAGTKFTVASGCAENSSEFSACGILENIDGEYFLNINGANNSGEISVSGYFVKSLNLREGDLISGKCKRASGDEAAGLAAVYSVNGVAPSAVASRPDFNGIIPLYPDRKLGISSDGSDIAGRIIDLLAPAGFGQRAYIAAPHGSGKTMLLKDMASGIIKNLPEVKPVILLIDARPEEVADFNLTFPAANIFASPFDCGAAGHVNTAKLALEYCKRQVEMNCHVVLFLDDLTRLTRAFDSCGRVTPYLDYSAVEGVKKLLASAKNGGKSCSLTIISTISTDGDELDTAVYSALKDACNMKISLSSKLAKSRIYPPLDVENTYSAGDFRLLTVEEQTAAAKIRELDLNEIIKLFGENATNAQIVEKYGR